MAGSAILGRLRELRRTDTLKWPKGAKGRG
jgi:hypothetical protein